jgi:hypothetical protein
MNDAGWKLPEKVVALESGVALRLPPHSKSWRQPGRFENVK